MRRHPIILQFCTEHGSDIAMLCAKFQDDWTIEAHFMDKRVFVRFEFMMSFGWIFHTAQPPSITSLSLG